MKFLIPAACIAAAAAAGAAWADGRAPRADERAAAPRVIPLPDPSEVPRRCPAAMRGVDLSLRPIAGGVALEFTSARRRQVPGLREQLREAAFAVEQYSKVSVRMLNIADSENSAPHVPPLDISVSDVGAGARVLVRTQRARDMPELIELARTFERMWSGSDCNEEIYVRARAQLPSERA
jgi:hypothetical protein